MRRPRGALRIGASGYDYPHWRGPFYPRELRSAEWFAYYAERFDTVEINNTFYRLPDAETFARWRRQAPPGFLYALKFSRYGSHLKRLRDPADTLAHFFERAGDLRSRMGPILVQLPPRWRPEPERLDVFLRSAPRRRFAVELRDPRWLCEEVYAVLRRHGAALVIHDGLADGRPHPVVLTADWSYLRFHGRDGGGYSPQALSGQARRIRRWLGEGRDVFAYFNNDRDACAPRDAAALRRYVR